MAKEHLLVVEDEEDILELLRYNLAKEGYRVTGALSGEEALRVARSSLPDLIVLDLMLPGMDGLTVCRGTQAGRPDPGDPHHHPHRQGGGSGHCGGLGVGGRRLRHQAFQPPGVPGPAPGGAAPPPGGTGPGERLPV